MSKRRIVVTGANRGIGLELVRAFVGLGHSVWGTARDPVAAEELAATGATGILPLDVSDPQSIAAFGTELAEATGTVDLLVNNAGVGIQSFGADQADGTVDNVDPSLISSVFEVNSLGPLLVTRSLLPLIAVGEAPLVCNISSQLGSMVVGANSGDVAYNVSKAALNMITVKFAAEHPSVAFVALHPGWVRTDMGGASAALGVEESASTIADTLLGLTIEDSGRFMNWDGSEHPW